MKSSDGLKSPDAAPEQDARETCSRLLSRRPRSKAELRERLQTGGFEASLIEEVLGGLEEAGLVDDEDFARSWIASRKAAGGAGRRKLRWELGRKGIARDLAEQVLEEELDEETELRAAADLARKRLRAGTADAREMSRLRRYLLARGFGFETVDSVVETVARQKGDEP
jgi:regulatory protein